MADVIKKLGHTTAEVDEHLDSAEQHIQEGEREKWNKAADTANTASTTAATAQSEAAINRTTLGYQGKNLLNVTASSQTINGITFTVNDDKSITATGTATANAIFKFYTGKLPAGQYKYSGLNVTPTASTANMSVFNTANWTSIVSLNSADEFTLTAETTVECRAVIYAGYTADNVVFYPMLRYAEIADDTYEPYAESVDERLAALETLNGDVHIGGYTIKSGESLTLSNISIAVIHFARTGGAESTSKSSMHAVYVAANTSIDHIKTAVNMTIESTTEGEFTITNNSTMTTVGMIFYKLRS